MDLNLFKSHLKPLWKKFEPLFALLVAVFHVLPFWFLNTLPTMDGAAHLYNANVIQHLLSNPDSSLANIYQFNPYPVPNWTGHLGLMALNIWLPDLLAEKLFLTGYVLVFLAAFRWLVSAINADNKLLSYLAFPFMYTIMFFTGFYNFSLSVVLMLLTLACWISRENEAKRFNSIGFLIAMTALMVVTYFSHIIGFAFLVFTLFIRLVYHILYMGFSLKYKLGTAIKELKGQVQALVITAILPGVAMLHYLLSKNSTGNYEFIDKTELLTWIYKIRPLVTFHFGKETPFLKPVFFLLLLLIILGILLPKIKEWRNKRGDNGLADKYRLSGPWVVTATVVLVLYLLLPKSTGSAGFISVRFCYFFFLVTIFWIATLRLPLWTRVLAVVVALVSNFGSNTIYHEYFKQLDEVGASVHKASKHIKPHSTVFPINKGQHWMTAHYHCYLGTEKPVAMLQNYECAVGYFPLHWNEANTPNLLLGNMPKDSAEGLRWHTNQNNPSQPIDYCFILGSMKDINKQRRQVLKACLEEYYALVYKDDHCQLYQLKKSAATASPKVP